MKEKTSELGGKAIALLVLLIAAWLLFKFVIGVVSAVAWFAVVIIALVAVVWSLNRLL